MVGITPKENGNVSLASLPATLVSRLEVLSEAIEDRLERLSEHPGFAGDLARQILKQGIWLEKHVEQEWALRKEAIGGIDNMWILLSSVSKFNPVCTATFIFHGKVDATKLGEAIDQQVEIFPKYKQVLRNRGRKFHGSIFVDDPNWDVRRHVIHYSLPEPAGRKELDEFTAEYISSEWDFDKPLWEMAIIDNYRQDGVDGSALVTRGHHTLTDGQGFVMSQLYISSMGEDLARMLSEGKATIQSARRGTAQPSKIHKRLQILDQFQNTLPLQIFMFTMFWLIWITSSLLEFLGGFAQGLSFASHFLFDSWRQRHVTSAYAGERVKAREFSTSPTFPMSDVKKLQRAFSGPSPGGWFDKALGRKEASWWGHLTLNDIFVTILADVISDELEQQEPVKLKGIWPKIKDIANSILPNHIALMIPISIRPVANWEMRNWSTGSVVWLPLPSGMRHGLPLGPRPMHARLHTVARRLRVLKNSLLPTLTFWSVQLTGQAPIIFPSAMWTPLRKTVQLFLELVLESFSAVVTNVPGPPSEIEFADTKVVRWAASPPQAGKGTLGIGIISYADTICITIAADHVINAPSEGVAERLTNAFTERWQQYLHVADNILERRGTAARRASISREK